MEYNYSIVYLVVFLYFSSTVHSKYSSNESIIQPSCKSQIFCYGELLHDVQMARIYSDSKTFVDKKLKYPESEIIEKYKSFKDKFNIKTFSNSELIKFIDEHLEDGNELEEWTPPDFIYKPSIINRIRDKTYKEWAFEMNRVWPKLSKKIKNDVIFHPEKYSLIWVPNGFVIPGGRFTELYYWDTYWIINGLLLCDMTSTAKGMIDNILSMVSRYGFMPNGGRVYYLNRTQPPMLILMALEYYKATNDFDYIKNIIGDLETEYDFWMENRMIKFYKDGRFYTMARYYAPSRGPRPESYREDYEIAEQYDTEEKREDFYVRIKSGAETGWDFSSRWFITANGSNHGQLSDIQAHRIIPVDLNSILHLNAVTLSTWFDKMGSVNKANKYKEIAQTFLTSIQEVMWRSDKGTWLDWDLINNKHRDYFYGSNFTPLWTGSYDLSKASVSNAVLSYLKNEGVLEDDYSTRFNGTPTSMYESSQQWDYPNAWPPLQAILIQGLDKTQEKLAQQVARNLADVWLRTNFKGFGKKRNMFEKYNVLKAGKSGGGGEYVPQTGFGWTNGVAFELLNRWGNEVSYGSDGLTEPPSNTSETLPEILPERSSYDAKRLKRFAKRFRFFRKIMRRNK